MPMRSLPYSRQQLADLIVLDFFRSYLLIAVRALTLLIRNPAALQFADNDKPPRALEALLSRCRITSEPGNTTAGWICNSLGVERQRDWPVGAMLAQAHGPNDDNSFWICAQPVHLAIDRDVLILQPRSQLQLSELESRSLFSSLQPQLAEAELETKYIDTGLWCVGTRRLQELKTVELEAAEGHNIDGLLPSGKDAVWWQRLILEVQMILHEHPVNVAREQRGENPVNSLWLWGGGTAPVVRNRFAKMRGSDPLLRAAAKLSRAQLTETAENFANFFTVEDEQGLVEFVLPPHHGARQSLSRLEADWIMPAWEALASGRLDEFTLVLPLPEAVVVCHCDRKGRRKFWKRRQALPRFLSQWAVSP